MPFVPGSESEIRAGGLNPFVVPDIGLPGDSGRAERRLSGAGDARRLFDEARGEGVGRSSSRLPSRLLDRPKLGRLERLGNPEPEPEFPRDGDDARLNPPWMLCRLLFSIVPKRLFLMALSLKLISERTK